MKLSKLNEWLSLAANIGVIAGIFFLVIEIQQNTDAQLVASRQQMLEADLSIIDDLMENPEFLLEANNPDISDTDYTKLRMYWVKSLRSREYAWIQYRDGLMDDKTWESYFKPIENTFSTGRGKEYIENDNYLGSTEFLLYVRCRLRQSNVAEC